MRLHQKSWLALTVPLPALIVLLPGTRFPNNLAPKEPNKKDLNGPLANFEI